MNTKLYLVLSGSIFGLVGLLHLIRLIYQWPVKIGTQPVPLWMSGGALVFAIALCIWAGRLTASEA